MEPEKTSLYIQIVGFRPNGISSPYSICQVHDPLAVDQSWRRCHPLPVKTDAQALAREGQELWHTLHTSKRAAQHATCLLPIYSGLSPGCTHIAMAMVPCQKTGSAA